MGRNSGFSSEAGGRITPAPGASPLVIRRRIGRQASDPLQGAEHVLDRAGPVAGELPVDALEPPQLADVLGHVLAEPPQDREVHGLPAISRPRLDPVEARVARPLPPGRLHGSPIRKGFFFIHSFDLLPNFFGGFKKIEIDPKIDLAPSKTPKTTGFVNRNRAREVQLRRLAALAAMMRR